MRRTRLLSVLAAAAGLPAVLPSCLTRPLANSQPQVNTTFTAVVRDQTIDKVDILFVIDNSASMGDKQEYLAEAVPLLIQRLVQPNCVDAPGHVVGQSDAGGLGTCTTGAVEFPPVHDMHIGVISTSLGTRLSDRYGGGAGTICDPNATLALTSGATFPNHNDDRGELVARTNPIDTSGDPLGDAGTLHYLNWFPNVPKNTGKLPSAGAPAIASATTLTNDFKSLIQGVGSYGCGIESQLESWYRFLVQPDPYDSLSLDGSGNAQWVGVDATILAQRQAFLRPDSLVAIIDMTDENDSEVDVRAVGGKGYWWMATNFNPWKGTPGCAENAAMSGLTDMSTCQSCGFQGVTCASPDQYTSPNDWGMNTNLRHVRMMEKYGTWPQFPIQRYFLGLTSKTIPDRVGEYPSGANSYQGLTNLDCTNPLFAASLPDGSSTDAATLCNLPPGPRTPDLVYYAHIGGVPHRLLQSTPGDGTCPAGTPAEQCPPKETLGDADWEKILGRQPLMFDYTGIDPHMLESYAPRAGIPAAPASADADGVSDWVTDEGPHVLEVDREYACTFPLATPRNCALTSDPTVSYACDCPSADGLTPQQLPPLCDPTAQTKQIAAKAYPTARELLLAKLMGRQGFVSSLCPINVTPSTGNDLTDPLFGYNPAVNGIVDRLKVSLSNQCLPQTLTQDSSGAVPCLILLQLAQQGAPGLCENPGNACDPQRGLLGPGVVPAGASAPTLTQDILNKFCEGAEAQYQGDAGAAGDPSTYPVCALAQLTPTLNPGDFNAGSCAGSNDPGWCYVTGAAAKGCPRAILFSPEPPAGSTVSLQCIENAVSVVDGGGG
jgi:hypothetical protein